MVVMDGIFSGFDNVEGLELRLLQDNVPKEDAVRAQEDFLKRLFVDFYDIRLLEQRPWTGEEHHWTNKFYLSNKVPGKEGEDIVIDFMCGVIGIEPARGKYGRIDDHFNFDTRGRLQSGMRTVYEAVDIRMISSPREVVGKVRNAVVFVRGIYDFLNDGAKITSTGSSVKIDTYQLGRLTGFPIHGQGV